MPEPDEPFTTKVTINSNAQIYKAGYNPTSEPPYPSGLKIEQQKSIQMIERHEHDAEAHAKRTLLVTPDGEPVDELNPLPVEAKLEVGDITIGAVEIKDGSSEVRATVIQQNGDTALLVKDINEYEKNTVNIYGDTSVAWDDETTLAVYPVPAGRTLKFGGVIVGGCADGLFTVTMNSIKVFTLRNSAASRTLIVFLKNDLTVNAGGEIRILVKNVGSDHQTKIFEGTINGYTIPV
jgi:hypothetical protein